MVCSPWHTPLWMNLPTFNSRDRAAKEKKRKENSPVPSCLAQNQRAATGRYALSRDRRVRQFDGSDYRSIHSYKPLMTDWNRCRSSCTRCCRYFFFCSWGDERNTTQFMISYVHMFMDTMPEKTSALSPPLVFWSSSIILTPQIPK